VSEAPSGRLQFCGLLRWSVRFEELGARQSIVGRQQIYGIFIAGLWKTAAKSGDGKGVRLI
jgi:hypothetical protein